MGTTPSAAPHATNWRVKGLYFHGIRQEVSLGPILSNAMIGGTLTRRYSSAMIGGTLTWRHPERPRLQVEPRFQPRAAEPWAEGLP